MSLLPQSSNCEICKNALKDPRILSCLHTFCTNCLKTKNESKKLIGKSSTNTESSDSASGYESEKSSNHSFSSSSSVVESNSYISCPICNTPSHLPKNGIFGLPINHLANKLNVPLPHSCVSCDLCMDEALATGMCKDCKVNLCDFCTKAHKRQKLTTNHFILLFCKKEETINPNCVNHKNEKANFICETCNEVICNRCLLTHQTHKYNSFLEVGKRNIELLTTLRNKVDIQLNSLQTTIKNFNAMGEKLDSRLKALTDNIDTFINEYISALKCHKQNLHNLASQLTKEQYKKLEYSQFLIKYHMDNLNLWINFVSTLLKHDSKNELFELSELAIKRIRVLMEPNPKEDFYEPTDFQLIPAQPAGILNGFRLFGSISSSAVDPKNCLLKPIGMEGTGSRCYLLITRDAHNLPFIQGQQNVQAFFASKDNPDKRFPARVEDKLDGSYLLTFPQMDHSLYLLHVLISGQHIQGSPFSLQAPPIIPHKKASSLPIIVSSTSSGEGISSRQPKLEYQWTL